MRSISNKRVDLKNVTKDMVNIGDIAHALAYINRFNGHTQYPYSVLAHSMCASVLMPEGKKMEGLLHDAAEAYIGDITTPVKELFPEVCTYEDTLLAVILEEYDINNEANIVNGSYKKSPAMLTVDRRLGNGEHYVLRPECGGTHDSRVAELMETYRHATPEDFLRRYEELL